MEIIKKIYQYAEPNLSPVGWLGFIGFPLYYYIWAYIFPQPYESLWMRIIGSVLCLVLALRNHLPEKLKPYLPYYYFLSIGYCLPFFFGYMMIMNHYNNIWCMSFITSICLQILLIHDTKLLILQSIISFFLSYIGAYLTIPSQNYNFIDWEYVPIFLFIYIFGNVFYCRNQMSHEIKISLAKSFGAGIAHEMRNPLSAIKSSIEILKPLLNTPIEQNDKDDKNIANDIIIGMENIVDSANNTISLLLTSIDQNRIPTSTFKLYSALEVINNAVNSFSYKCPQDKDKVHILNRLDFDFLGSDTLIKYLIYNLIKNAFNYNTNDNFHIDISFIKNSKWNIVKIKDNGIGINPSEIKYIFKDFYTHGKNGGYGLGLPFCRRVMTALGGNITCESIPGDWTEFTLHFPKESSKQMTILKNRLLHERTLLYIGEDGNVSTYLRKQSNKMNYHLNILTLSEALLRKEHEFEFDLILIDLDNINRQWLNLTVLEGLLHFTEATLFYIYTSPNCYPINIERYLSIHPINITDLLTGESQYLYQLFFNKIDKIDNNKNLIPITKQRTERCILITDDNLSVRNLTSLLLEQQGYTVFQASNGHKALDIVNRHNIDLILMDIEMPGLNGFETTHIIRNSKKEYNNIPILGHTGDNNTLMIKRMIDYGMNDYIIKPTDKNILLDKISDWI